MKYRHKLRLDMVGVTVSVGAIIVGVALIWFAGKLGEYQAMKPTPTPTEQPRR